MKKFLILALALVLSGCSAFSPVSPTSAPPPTAQVIIATVLVPVVATQPPTPQVIVVTATPANTQVVPSPTNSGGATATATLPAGAGGDLFTSLSRSGSYFALNCLPKDITFNVSTSNIYVTEVHFYYHMEDLTTQPPTISTPKDGGKMVGDKNGNYTIDFNTLMISPDTRATAKAWFDYQFVGFNKLGDKVGSSLVITKQIYYTKDCP
jgi:hypothetical protein